MVTRLQITMLGSLCLVTLCGCEAFVPAKELPQITYKDIGSRTSKPAISFEVHVDYVYLSNEQKQKPDFKSFLEKEKVEARTLLERVLNESGLFTGVHHDNPRQSYHVVFEWKCDDSIREAWVSHFASGFTFGVVPGMSRCDYTLVARVVRGREAVKECQYSDHLTEITGLAAIVLAFANGDREKVVREVRENIIRVFLRDAVCEGLFWTESPARHDNNVESKPADRPGK